MKSQITRLASALLSFCIVAPAAAQAPKFPSHPIQIIVTFAPGGTADALARTVAKEMAVSLGEGVVVVNRPGASGLIGTDYFAKARPDGYTLGVVSVSQIALPFAMKSVPYDTRTLRPITLIGSVPGLLSANPSLPVKTLQDVVKLAHQEPGKLAYGNAGMLTASHLAMEMMKLQTDSNILNVPYKGGDPALLGLVSGEVPLGISGPTAHLPFIESGALRPIATTGAARSSALPDVPTFAESGLPGFELADWYGLFAPPETPDAIIDIVQKNVALALSKPEIRDRLKKLGVEPGGMNPQAYATFVAEETDKIGKLVTKLHLKME